MNARLVGFLRNVWIALVLFLIIGIADEIDLPVARDVEAYVRYALTNELDLELLLDKIENVGGLADALNWDKVFHGFSTPLRPIPAITPGETNRSGQSEPGAALQGSSGIDKRG